MKDFLRSRTWFIITYNSDFNDLLQSCKHWAWIYHDKDKVVPHYHILCVFKNARALSGIKTMIHGEQNTLGEIVKTTLKNCYEYMLHGETGEKHEYEEKERFCDNTDFWKSCTNSPDNTSESMINDILNGIPLRELAKRYGRDFMKNWRSYTDFCFCLAQQENGSRFPYECILENIDFSNTMHMRANGQIEIITPNKKK